ncbi:MAG: hypothetical protein Q3979_09870, partial [Actinomycetaceae bacterium]|nr:hypothetical protein [Actinomycetaceae bacterium]
MASESQFDSVVWRVDRLERKLQWIAWVIEHGPPSLDLPTTALDAGVFSAGKSKTGASASGADGSGKGAGSAAGGVRAGSDPRAGGAPAEGMDGGSAVDDGSLVDARQEGREHADVSPDSADAPVDSHADVSGASAGAGDGRDGAADSTGGADSDGAAGAIEGADSDGGAGAVADEVAAADRTTSQVRVSTDSTASRVAGPQAQWPSPRRRPVKPEQPVKP